MAGGRSWPLLFPAPLFSLYRILFAYFIITVLSLLFVWCVHINRTGTNYRMLLIMDPHGIEPLSLPPAASSTVGRYMSVGMLSYATGRARLAT